jgi:hypothetical protein
MFDTGKGPQKGVTMTTMLQMPAVRQCTATACSFNDGGCHAPAVTVTAIDDAARCATFVETPVRGGHVTVTGAVGACSRADCVHNEDLTCHAEAVSVGQGRTVSDCLTYRRAA